ncbi:MAG: hypothetical protein II483_04285 [Lachnospiraceae bacterium]|nr:hypothetical protein [Lachnospiraceae bacterium]
MSLLILEERSCQVIAACARRFHPDWSFDRFEAIQCNATDPVPEDGNRYEASYIFHIAGPALDELDREVPFLFPLERGTHYLWELFTELPRSGGSRSSRQFWNRLSRAMSWIEMPITTDELVARFEEASLALLQGAIDMGDRFYLPSMDYGGWNGGIVTKDFLIDGLKMLAVKLEGPARESRRRKKEEEEAAAKAAEEAAKAAAEAEAKAAAEAEVAAIAEAEARAAAEANAVTEPKEETSETKETETNETNDTSPVNEDASSEEKETETKTGSTETFTEGGNEDEGLSGRMD